MKHHPGQAPGQAGGPDQQYLLKVVAGKAGDGIQVDRLLGIEGDVPATLAQQGSDAFCQIDRSDFDAGQIDMPNRHPALGGQENRES